MKFTKPTFTRQPSALPSTLAPLLLMLAGLAAALLLLWLLLFAPAADSYRSDLSQAYASQQQSALNRTLAQLDADLTRVAANPQLQRLLRQQSPADAGALRYQLAGQVASYLHRPGAAVHIDDEQAPLSFAALDMIRRAERGLTVPAEAHKVGEHWRLYLVKPLRVSPTAPIAGTLLAVFDLQRLTGSLPLLPQDAGKIALIQQFAGAPAQALYQAGSGHGASISHTTDNPAWRLEFQPGSAMGAGAPNPLVLLAAVLIALAGALASLLFLQRSWTQALNADAQTLEQLTQGHKAAGLRLGPLEPLAQRIMQLANRARQGVTNETGKPATPAAAPEPSPAAPLPPLEDVLDIDIVDDLADSPATGIPALPAEIFRAYDIRGVVGRTLTADYVYWLGRAIGSDSLDAGQPQVAVARDGRLSGPDLMEQLIRGLTDCGCEVLDLGMVPTPVLYYATHTTAASSGVMLTGSHNPPDYNGLKIVVAGQTLSGERISALHQRLQ